MIDIPARDEQRMRDWAARIDALFEAIKAESGVQLHWTFSFGLEDPQAGGGGPVYISGGDNPLASLQLALGAVPAHMMSAKKLGATAEQVDEVLRRAERDAGLTNG